MPNPFTAKAKEKSKLKSFGSKPSGKRNGKVNGEEATKLNPFTAKLDRVTNVGKKQSEDWIIGQVEIQLEEHNNLWWAATVTLDGESRVFHNKHGSWFTDRTEEDNWPMAVTMQEAIPDLAQTLAGYLNDELKRLGRKGDEEKDAKPKRRGK